MLQNSHKVDDETHCVICLDTTDKPKQLDCGHRFCTSCIDTSFNLYHPKCPSCGKLYGPLNGNQPPGLFKATVLGESLPGYPGIQTIVITYQFNSGIQTQEHPNPGQPYHGTVRYAYLPNNAEGQEACALLRRAFDARLVFTVGRSVTTGIDNCVIWNDIHHKTSFGGPYGYPDPTYLSRLKQELAVRGIIP